MGTGRKRPSASRKHESPCPHFGLKLFGIRNTGRLMLALACWLEAAGRLAKNEARRVNRAASAPVTRAAFGLRIAELQRPGCAGSIALPAPKPVRWLSVSPPAELDSSRPDTSHSEHR